MLLPGEGFWQFVGRGLNELVDRGRAKVRNAGIPDVRCSSAVMDSMSRWLVKPIQYQAVGAGNHHLGKQATDLSTAGQDSDLFHPVFPGKKHTSREAAGHR